MFGYPESCDDCGFDATDSAPHMPKAVVLPEAGPRTGHGALVRWPETTLYELHVKGFTKRHPEVPAAVRGTFAGLGHPAAVDHLVKLGVTSIEIMPPAHGSRTPPRGARPHQLLGLQSGRLRRAGAVPRARRLGGDPPHGGGAGAAGSRRSSMWC
jgi:hypothetical protein